MKKLNEFKAFALSKAQMNALAGGEIYCSGRKGLNNEIVDITYSDGFSLDEAYASASAILEDPVCEEVIRA